MNTTFSRWFLIHFIIYFVYTIGETKTKDNYKKMFLIVTVKNQNKW